MGDPSPSEWKNLCWFTSERAQKPNSWTYKFVEVSEHNLESSQTWGFHIQCLHYKPVSNHFFSREREGRGDCEKQGGKLLRLLSKNSASIKGVKKQGKLRRLERCRRKTVHSATILYNGAWNYIMKSGTVEARSESCTQTSENNVELLWWKKYCLPKLIQLINKNI